MASDEERTEKGESGSNAMKRGGDSAADVWERRRREETRKYEGQAA